MVTPIDWTSDSFADRREPWDLVVLGGGTAGIVAAKTAAGLGSDVLLIERHRTGGDCLWTGCVPSKALLGRAHQPDASATDFAAAMAHVHASIAAIEPIDSPDDLRAAGVTVVHGDGEFTGPRSLTVNGTEVRFRHTVLATGSSPVVPTIPGLEKTDVLTSDSVWSLTTRPEQLLVIGAGSIGCELGQAFARLGTAVTIVESGARILPNDDADAAAILLSVLTADGAAVRTGVSVTGFDGAIAALSDGGTVEASHVLLAVGRRPNTAGFGLDRAGVELGPHGHAIVDKRLRTTSRRIWAAGDVTNNPAFTHVAGVHGSQAATNAVLGVRRSVDLATVPRVTYTQPEVAAFGVGLDDVGLGGVGSGGANGRFIARTVLHDEVDRAIVEERTDGFSRLVLNRRGRIVGATIVSPRAGESLAEVVLAARHQLRARDIAASMHAYPTYADGVWKAALAQLQDDLARPWLRRVVKMLQSVRRLLHRA